MDVHKHTDTGPYTAPPPTFKKKDKQQTHPAGRVFQQLYEDYTDLQYKWRFIKFTQDAFVW